MLRHPLAWIAGLLTGAVLTAAGSLYLYGAPPALAPAPVRAALGPVATALHALPHPWAVGTTRAHLDAILTPAAAEWARADQGSIASAWCWKGGREAYGATAWSVRSDGVWMTAGHFGAGCAGLPVTLQPWGAGWRARVPARVWAVHDGADVAVLTAGRLRRPAIPLAWETVNPAGQVVATYNDATTTGFWPSRVWLATDLGPAASVTNGPGGYSVNAQGPELSRGVHPGMSGSPVLDAEGQVIGMVSQGNAYRTWTVPVSVMRTWVPWAQ